ncbi:MAG TPA: SRPBCC family protein [Terriglobales bacterium]|jgi:activator of HSP90 ATPase|nr:SRPBCC family protein [Terriglobales bacterium]
MKPGVNPTALTGAPTRRRLVYGIVAAVGGMVAASSSQAQTQPAMTEAQSTGTEGLLTYLHQEIEVKATSQRIYDALLDSKQFAALTGLPAEISRDPGGTFSMFGGLIVGRNIELVPNQRIVQAWRPASWDPGLYSMVRFELKGQGSGTKVVLDHTGFPEGSFRHLDSGWYERYWEPLKKFLR